jgi:heme exporter protein CcmD
MNFHKFLQMDGYAPYVWSSYALTLVVLAANAWWARNSLQQALRIARKRMQDRAQQGST